MLKLAHLFSSALFLDHCASSGDATPSPACSTAEKNPAISANGVGGWVKWCQGDQAIALGEQHLNCCLLRMFRRGLRRMSGMGPLDGADGWPDT